MCDAVDAAALSTMFGGVLHLGFMLGITVALLTSWLWDLCLAGFVARLVDRVVAVRRGAQ